MHIIIVWVKCLKGDDNALERNLLLKTASNRFTEVYKIHFWGFFSAKLVLIPDFLKELPFVCVKIVITSVSWYCEDR